MKFTVIAFPYSIEGRNRGTGAGPAALLQGGLLEWMREQGHEIVRADVALTPEERAAYGTWNRMGFANAHLARHVAGARRRDTFPLLLESNCYCAVGALAGLQKVDDDVPTRIGMVWLDAHGDFNTPETTLSGMLSGMPVAMAAGLCLERLRKQMGLDTPVAARDVVMVGVRANDPLEQALIDRHGIEIVPVADFRGGRTRLRAALERLSAAVDAIYVHFDIDVLDASEVCSMWLSAPDGPTCTELAGALELIMGCPRVAAFGVADVNPGADETGQMVQSSLTALYGGITGLTAYHAGKGGIDA